MSDISEPWSVHVTPGAIAALERLPYKIAAALTQFISGTLPKNPHGLSKPLRGQLSGWHVTLRGDYKVTFRILDDDHTLPIGRIEHRAHLHPPAGIPAPSTAKQLST